MEPKKTFHVSMSQLLEKKLSELQKKENFERLNVHVCTQIYKTIFETLVEIIEGGKVELTNEAANYVAQQYYDGTLINGRHELDPEIFEKRAKLENIESRELAMIGSMLRGTDFLLPVVAELKKRS